MTDDLTLDDLPTPERETRVHPEELYVDGDNPNEQTDEMFGLLCDNLRGKGWIGNAIVADADGCIADGEHRWRAAQEIGLTEVPVKFYNIDDTERRLWRQELNKISGEHDPKRDALEYDQLLSEGRTDEVEALTDAADEDLDDLLAELQVDTGQSPAYEYEVDHEVYFEDCVDGMRERLADNSVDCVITDPPYGVDWNTSSHRSESLSKIEADGSVEDAIDLFNDAASEFSRVLSESGHAYVFTRWDVAAHFRDVLTQHGFEVPNCIAWVKNNIGLNDQSYQYRPKYELILYAHRDAPRSLENREGDVMEFDRPNGGEHEHPTVKPISLIAQLLRNSTSEGDRVLDPFMGSGTTAVAAIQNDREYVGFEVDAENYRDVIERRIGEAKRQREAGVNTAAE
jgi:DNA modification methylase